MKESHSDADVAGIFEKCWKELLKEYETRRLFNVYCSEADIQLHFASKLLGSLRFPTCVYVEFPISFDVGDFMISRMNLGKPRRKRKKGEGIIADIVIMGGHEIIPSIFAEIKYGPLIWNYLPILQAVEGKLTKERKEDVKEALLKTIERLRSWEEYGPSQSVVYDHLKNVDKIIRLIKDFEEWGNGPVYAYYCVINEIYPKLGQLMEDELHKHNAPDEIRLRFHHNSVRSWLEDQLSKL